VQYINPLIRTGNTGAYVGAFLLACLFLASCSGRKEDSAVARAYDAYLYPEDLDQIVNEGTSASDSQNLVSAYIDQWQRQQVLLHHAQQNVRLDIAQINKQIEEYRNSLVIYELEQAIIRDKLDTVVTEQEINDYYSENEAIFLLKRPIFKASYLTLEKNAPDLPKVRKWLASDDDADRQRLRAYAEQYSRSFSLADTSWYYMEELAKKIPIAQIDENNYRNYGQIFNITENNKIYLIILHDSKFKDNRSPLAIERNNIRNLIINRRKIALISKEEQELINKARNQNKIEVYHP
jgi:hypothetical protein